MAKYYVTEALALAEHLEAGDIVDMGGMHIVESVSPIANSQYEVAIAFSNEGQPSQPAVALKLRPITVFRLTD